MRFASVLLALLLISGIAVFAQAQQLVIHYVYDDLGRLVGVVDPDGNAATYTYDAVGNILAIGRHNVADTAGPVAITLVNPNQGNVGTAVLIFGKGFSPDPAQNVVSFSGTPATVSVATPTSLTTSVPPGALTGLITVTTPLGTATSPEPFTVLGAITISPKNAVLFVKATLQFIATESGTATPTVTWSVNGVGGGNATVGTISATGLYSAPAAVPSSPTETVTATNTADPSLFDSAAVIIIAAPDKIVAQPVSVAMAPTPTAVNNLMAQPVSVQFARSPLQANSAQAALVSAAFAPFITALTPTSAVAGGPPFLFRVDGEGLAGATDLQVLLAGSPDPNVLVSGVSPAADGRSLTATMTIAGTAVLGPRIVRVVTPTAASSGQPLGTNVFSVTSP